ncbi:MAG: adenylate/guanylate cyclase domain-containing protein, partial [Candidatus Desantisbacteria bacterium]
MSKETDSEISLEKALKNTEEFQRFFESKKESKIIMFADMVGSTAYKYDHSMFDGFRKVMRHNNTIIEIITEFRGKKIKEIGDEVMVCFDSDKGEGAINAAVKIQETFNNINSQEKREGVEKIESQIGITYGKEDVLLLDNGDIHGTPVDVAKRLVAMAKPMQILIDGNLKANIKEDKITSKYLDFKHKEPVKIQPKDLFSKEPARRKAKGIKEEIEIYEVRWSSEFLGVKDKDRLASEWKKAHEYLTNILPYLDRL